LEEELKEIYILLIFLLVDFIVLLFFKIINCIFKINKANLELLSEFSHPKSLNSNLKIISTSNLIKISSNLKTKNKVNLKIIVSICVLSCYSHYVLIILSTLSLLSSHFRPKSHVSNIPHSISICNISPLYLIYICYHLYSHLKLSHFNHSLINTLFISLFIFSYIYIHI